MMTEKDNIERLLEKFMLGETTEQEERLLALYFATEKNIPDEWKEYAAMFAAFADGEPNFSEEEKDAFCKKVRPIRRRLTILPWVAAAASIALLIVFLSPASTDEQDFSQSAISQTVVSNSDSMDLKNTGSGDRLIAQEFIPTKEEQPKRQSQSSVNKETSPKGEESNPIDEAPVINHYATNSQPLQDNDECVHYCRYDGDINAPRMHTDLEVRQVMLECEQALLEEEFQENDIKYRTVSL